MNRNEEIDTLTLEECKMYIRASEGLMSDALNRITYLEIELEQWKSRALGTPFRTA